MEKPRTCFYILSDQRDDEGYVPSMVTEDQPGHTPMTGNGECAQPWHWGRTYDEARETAERENLALGITPDDALEIVLSSMRAGRPWDQP